MIQFPFCVPGEHGSCSDPPVVELRVSKDRQKILNSFIIGQGQVFQVFEHEVKGDGVYFIALRGLTRYDPPRRSVSPGSQALYLAESQGLDRIFLLQYLPPHSVTSRHFHDKPVEETYHALTGEAVLATRGNGDTPGHDRRVTMYPQESHHMTSGVIHQLKTGEMGALVLVEIVGHIGSLEDLVHNYVED